MKLKKNQRNRMLFIFGTIIIAGLFIVTVINLYEFILSDAKINHQMQQMEMAKAAASGIKIYIDQLSDDLYLLSEFPGVKEGDPVSLYQSAEQVYNHYRDKIVRSIFFINSKNDLILSVGGPMPANITELFSPYGQEEIWFSKIKPVDSVNIDHGLFFTILSRIYQPDNSGNYFYAGFFISFDSLVQKYIAPLKLGEGDFAWVLDGRGRLIYHPNHEEMLLRNISQASDDCISCHSSFDIQKRMIRENASTGEYTIGDEPPKIMAYTPIHLNNEKWILAISTFLPEVTAGLREKFTIFFGLGVIILIVIVSLGSLLYYTNIKKFKVEEANRHLEQRQVLQEQLNHAAKLASIGELVDGVAHEINTPLGVIFSHIDAIRLQKDYPEKYDEDLSIIRKQAKRINKYTKSLLGYSQRMTFNPGIHKITGVIEDCLYMLSPRFHSKKIKVIKRYKYSLPDAYFDKGYIEQVLINILNNAADAVENHGEIKIETDIEIHKINSLNENDTEFLSIIITDNGSGIKPENLESVFEPFFTTKSADKGTGLGLSISKAIILRHKGKIEVKSEHGKYTSFKILLPLNRIFNE